MKLLQALLFVDEVAMQIRGLRSFPAVRRAASADTILVIAFRMGKASDAMDANGGRRRIIHAAACWLVPAVAQAPLHE
jgi:hypothetical protein